MVRLSALATALLVLLMAAPALAADRYRNPLRATIPATLFAMGGPGGHVAEFDYVRVSSLSR